jgi:threonine/homoserine/homoserine lactone efflux protein
LLFMLVVAGFAAIPGPSNVFVLSQGVSRGHTAGLAAALGCAAGAMGYVFITTAGLTALLASSVFALRALHFIGAAYLLYLAVRTFKGRGDDAAEIGLADERAGSPFRRGMLVELTNPKVALFFLALFPQFLHRAQGPAWSQTLILGCLFVSVGLLSDSAYAFASGMVGRLLRSNPRFGAHQRRFTGTLYLGLGVWAAAGGASAPER